MTKVFIEEITTRLCQDCKKADISDRHILTKFCPACQSKKNAILVAARAKKKREKNVN